MEYTPHYSVSIGVFVYQIVGGNYVPLRLMEVVAHMYFGTTLRTYNTL